MNPDVAKAIPELVERGILPAEKATHMLWAARGDVLSVRRVAQEDSTGPERTVRPVGQGTRSEERTVRPTS